MHQLINGDINATPIPIELWTNISTKLRFLLKYCPTIKFEDSLAIPIPIDKKMP
jgi:hypothetical protein